MKKHSHPHPSVGMSAAQYLGAGEALTAEHSQGAALHGAMLRPRHHEHSCFLFKNIVHFSPTRSETAFLPDVIKA